MNTVLQSGLSFYLDTPVKILNNRLLSEAAKRPLIASLPSGGLINFIEKKLDERALFYKQANVSINTSLEDVMEVIELKVEECKKIKQA